MPISDLKGRRLLITTTTPKNNWFCEQNNCSARASHFFNSTFLWRPLHDYDVKPPNAMFYGGCGHTTTNFPSSIWTWIKHLRIQLQEKLPSFDELSCSKKKNRSDKVWKEANSFIFFSDVFTAIVVIFA